MAIQPAQPFNAFMAGRQARQDEETAGVRNALAQQDIENSQVRNRMVEKQFSQQEVEAALRQTAAGAARLAQSQSPRAEAVKFYPEFAAKLKEQGVDINSMSDDEAREYFGFVAGQAQSKLGVGPAAPERMTPYQQAQIELQREKMNQPQTMSPYEQARIDIEQKKLNQPGPADTGPLVQIADQNGSPMWVTRDQAVNKPAYVARDKPAAADVKLQNDARMKLPRLKSVERSLERVEKASQAIAKGWFFDGGKVDQHKIDLTKEGQELIAAIAQMRPALTALTRVPGIGSQSDLEARLDGLQYPTSELPPEVRQRNIEELRSFVSDLRDVYQSVMSGGGQRPQEQAPQATAAPNISALLDKYAPQ